VTAFTCGTNIASRAMTSAMNKSFRDMVVPGDDEGRDVEVCQRSPLRDVTTEGSNYAVNECTCHIS
jgi:hypothetical protein